MFQHRKWWRCLLLGVLVVGLGWESLMLAEVLWWRTHDPSQTAFMRARSESRQARGLPPLAPHPWVPYDRIPVALKRAVVAAEDSRFVQHDGFDWQGIRQAYDRDVQRHRLVAGGSTISQQLAKNLFLSEHRTWWRKAQESILTVMLESFWSKRRILEVYLNTIEWGDGEFGCAAASRHYFGVTVERLSPSEAARLASMIPRPRFYDRHGPTEQLLDKARTIGLRMNQVSIP